MQITGNTIRDELKALELRKNTLETLFQDSLYAFEDETKKTPTELSDQIFEIESKIVRLQVLQLSFNAVTTVESRLLACSFSLAEVVKLVGSMERMTKLWSTTVEKKEKSPYRSSAPTAPVRKADQVTAKQVIDLEGKAAMIEKYSKLLGHLKGLVSEGNNKVVPANLISDPSLFG